jgi:hypothetical protein
MFFVSINSSIIAERREVFSDEELRRKKELFLMELII